MYINYEKSCQKIDRLIVTHKEIVQPDILIAASSKEICRMNCVSLACCV